jgi:hypothetical protein
MQAKTASSGFMSPQRGLSFIFLLADSQDKDGFSGKIFDYLSVIYQLSNIWRVGISMTRVHGYAVVWLPKKA